MTNANQEYFDAALRHQIGIRRYSTGLTKRLLALLEKADKELSKKLRDRLSTISEKPIDFTSVRWTLLLEEIKEARNQALKIYKNTTRNELTQLASLEAQREVSLLSSAIPIEVSFAAVANEQLRAIVSSQPFQGRFLREWFQTLEQNDQRRIKQTLQLGLLEGETTDNIVRRVIGTRKNNFSDGVLSITRRDAQAVVRTAVNHISNSARNAVWEANQDVVSARVWVSTLDGRTSAICRARDGKGTPVGNKPLPKDIAPLKPTNAHPPAHINCRSVMVAYLDGVGLLGNRPTVVDTRTRQRRETDFRKEAKRTGRTVPQVRKEWAARNIGQAPADTTYQDFLFRQPAKFQDEVLGKTKGRLFRKGGLKLDQFVDRAGNELTLTELAATQPEAFRKAGV